MLNLCKWRKPLFEGNPGYIGPRCHNFSFQEVFFHEICILHQAYIMWILQSHSKDSVRLKIWLFTGCYFHILGFFYAYSNGITYFIEHIYMFNYTFITIKLMQLYTVRIFILICTKKVIFIFEKINKIGVNFSSTIKTNQSFLILLRQKCNE